MNEQPQRKEETRMVFLISDFFLQYQDNKENEPPNSKDPKEKKAKETKKAKKS